MFVVSEDRNRRFGLISKSYLHLFAVIIFNYENFVSLPWRKLSCMSHGQNDLLLINGSGYGNNKKKKKKILSSTPNPSARLDR